MSRIKLEASQRDTVGKGNARALRREGKVPAVIYGDKKPPVSIALDKVELFKSLNRGELFTHVCDLNVDKDKHTVLARDVQFHPVSDDPLHVDFLRVTGKTRITADIPVHLLNEEKAIGLKEGGVLNVVRHKIEVSCLANAIPEYLEASLEGLDVGDSVKSNDIDWPEGVLPTIDDREFTIATIARPSIITVEEEEDVPSDEFQEAELVGEDGEPIEGEEGEAAEDGGEETKSEGSDE